MEPEVRRFPNLKDLGSLAAESILEIARDAVSLNGTFRIAISGGATPKTLFELLGEPPYKETMPWEKTQIFWVDERCLSEDHPDSNFSMAFASLISKVPIPTKNVRPIVTSLGPQDETAGMYEQLLRDSFDMKESEGFPSFDMILLGIGPDGHVASIFPGSDALQETKKWVISTPAPVLAPAVERITMTLPVINNARNVMFLVSGDGKKEIIQSIMDDREDAAEKYPAARVNPTGKLIWFLDEQFV